MADVLTLATAGLELDERLDTNHLRYPRVDYLELQRLIDMRILNYDVYDRSRFGGIFRYLETQVRSDIYLAMLGLREQYRSKVVFTMSERAGIPYSGLHRLVPGRRPLISMFTCWSPRQEYVSKSLNLFSSMDAILVHCQSMKRHLVDLGAPQERVHVIPYSIDHHFFAPQKKVEQQSGFILSVGEMRTRDYPSLLRAVDGLPLKLLVAAAGRGYAREKSRWRHTRIPNNVTVNGGFPQEELRKLYARSQFVVLPIYDSVFSAGATAVLEAMCMARAVIATRSRGIVDYVIDGETGILVDPNDELGLQQAVRDLLAHPKEAHRLGMNARQRVEEELNLDAYVNRLASLLQTYLDNGKNRPPAGFMECSARQ